MEKLEKDVELVKGKNSRYEDRTNFLFWRWRGTGTSSSSLSSRKENFPVSMGTSSHFIGILNSNTIWNLIPEISTGIPTLRTYAGLLLYGKSMKYARYTYVRDKQIGTKEIRYAVGISGRLVEEYLELVDEFANPPLVDELIQDISNNFDVESFNIL